MEIVKRNTDYALRLMARLARYRGREAVPARRLAEEEGVSVQLASKLLQRLSEAGFVQSRMGKRGGFLLRRAPDEISLAEMIAVIQGPIRFNQCTGAEEVCPHQSGCRIRGELKALQEKMNQVLESITLAELAR